jgi:hypothetical protein
VPVDDVVKLKTTHSYTVSTTVFVVTFDQVTLLVEPASVQVTVAV